MKNKDFCIFILTHGRPDRVYTYNTFVNRGYTGKIYIIIDNEDRTYQKYIEKFGDDVIIFDKLKSCELFDIADNFHGRRGVVYVRNAVFDIAEKLGIKYFIVLDDDYTNFRYTEDNKGNYITDKYVSNLDKMFENLLNFYINSNITCLAISQIGDFIGGEGSKVFKEKNNKKADEFVCLFN